jgi:arylsulfatase
MSPTKSLRAVSGVFSLALVVLFTATSAIAAPLQKRPNILLIVADDLGYSDLGVFGGEINTPNLDALAREGVALRRFHAAPNCGPSRAATLTGVDFHRAGMGGNVEVVADNQKGLPAYQGALRDDVVTFPELLRDGGYHTYMAGKWHMGKSARNMPVGRGFERSFALLNGGASHWADQLALVPNSKTVYTQDDVVVENLPDDFYSSTYYTDRIIEFIAADLEDDAPFFAYLAFTAPHNPLHAPDASIAKYKGAYDSGWDQLASNRLARQRELGLLAQQIAPAARPDWVLAWDELSSEQQAQRARDMEVYAAMIDYLDESVGRVLSFLRSKGEYENTMIVFMSDNGPSKTSIADYVALGGAAADFVKMFDNSLDNKGRPGSSTDIGPGWAFASATPLRLFKGYVTQGGIQVPAIIKPAGKVEAGTALSQTPLHVTDLSPTFLALAEIDYPAEYQGVPIPRPAGQSMLPLIATSYGAEKFARGGLGWEAYGMDAWLEGDMKLVRLPEPYGNSQWQLYNLRSDPGETNDLAGKMPKRVAEFEAKWLNYARFNEVVHPDKPVAYGKPVKPGRF